MAYYATLLMRRRTAFVLFGGGELTTTKYGVFWGGSGNARMG
eukprot:CAMPEP_0185748518 /NCGR_PEP_ID=MMETSP1174-20130828/7214_1 /TAXON_ID=35687 /ORGANISM="Dictyocha speculum, Strain CCMP1381" /LENGTH=41 /DNA_ID= /DNA_START= /DNA_END= /DNA_ORIENTATION=